MSKPNKTIEVSFDGVKLEPYTPEAIPPSAIDIDPESKEIQVSNLFISDLHILHYLKEAWRKCPDLMCRDFPAFVSMDGKVTYKNGWKKVHIPVVESE